MSGISPRRRFMGSMAGIFVEFYDFFVYGLSAPIIAAKFFPGSNPATALIDTFAIYAVSFVVRPLGGPFFGYLGDRIGRVAMMAATVVLMGIATTLTGLIPTYQTIGIFGPVLLLVCRLAQGFSAAGETSGALSYILESAPGNQRARWISAGLAASWLPVVLASVISIALRAGFGDAAFTNWGWRIPFLLGGVIALAGLWLRLRLDDPEEYREAASEAKTVNPIRSALRHNWRSLLTVALLVAVPGVSSYLMLSYMYSYLVTVVHLTATTALLANAAGIAAMSAMIIPCGMLADRYGRRPIMFAGAGWLLVLSWPALKIISGGGVADAILGQLILGAGVALASSGGFAAMLELFPTAVRFTGHGIGYNLGYVTFSGTAALVATALVGATGSGFAPAFYMMAIAVLGLVVVSLVRETRTVRLRDASTVASATTTAIPLADGLPTPPNGDPAGQIIEVTKDNARFNRRRRRDLPVRAHQKETR